MRGLFPFLREEAKVLWGSVREPAFFLAVGLFLVAYGVVLHFPLVLDLDVGAGLEPPRMNSFDHLIGRTLGERVGRPYEAAFLEGFYAEENLGGETLRWSEPEADLRIGGVNRGPGLLRLRMRGASSGGRTRLEIGGHLLAEFSPPASWYVYDLALAPEPGAGNWLVVHLASTPVRPGGEDTRLLGVGLERVTWVGWAYGRRFYLPPLALTLAGVVALFHLGLRRAGLKWTLAGGGSVLLGAALLAGLLVARPFTVAYAGGLLTAAALSYPILIVVLRAAAALLRRGQIFPQARTWSFLAVLFLVLFLLRFGGATSPRYTAHDASFHVNQLLFAERGLLFVPHVSIEAQLIPDPYPRAFYVLLAPLTLLEGNREVLLALVPAVLGSSEVFLLWFLARQVMDERAACWAVWLYVAFPIGWGAYWSGIYTNLFASWLVLVLVVGIVLVFQGRASSSWGVWVPAWSLFLLAHFGMLILWIPVLLFWGVWLYWRGGRRRRPALRGLWRAGLVAALLAVVLYYSAFAEFFGTMARLPVSLFQEAAASGEGIGPSPERTRAELEVWWRWGVVVDYGGVGFGLGVLGFGLLWRRRKALWVLLGSMLVVAAFFWAVSMLVFFFTRYMLFLLPPVAIGGGSVLAAWWRRGQAGRVVAAILGAYIGWITLFMWLGLCLLGLRPPHVI
ncbi:MAG: hypothetical protein ACP5OO_11705 [Chloroflexia bacterium]